MDFDSKSYLTLSIGKFKNERFVTGIDGSVKNFD